MNGDSPEIGLTQFETAFEVDHYHSNCFPCGQILSRKLTLKRNKDGFGSFLQLNLNVLNTVELYYALNLAFACM